MLYAMVGFGTAVCLLGVLLAARLLRRGIERRAAPELALALHFTLITALGYQLRIAGIALLELEPELSRQLFKLSDVGLILASGPIAIFTWKVFRPASIPAGSFALGLTGATGVVLARVLGLGSGVPGDEPLLGPQLALSALAIGWASLESLLHYRRALRRAAIGLVEPLVANRFLLWGIATASMLLTAALRNVLIRDVGVGGPEVTPYRFALALGQTGFGAAAIVSIWFTFYPPARYRRRFEGRASLRAGS